jgi:hypothetical protein
MLAPALAFLLVEDDPPTLRVLRWDLTQEYPSALVHTAETVEGAEKRIADARRQDVRYKVAVVDVFVPSRPGAQPEPDFVLMQPLGAVTTRDAVIFHTTAYGEPADFRDFLDQRSRRGWELRQSALYVPFPKANGWTERLYGAIRGVVHGDRIRERFERLFGPPLGEAPALRGRYTATHVPCDPTQELAALARDIERHYNSLDADLKNQLEKVFTITTDAGRARVSLL